MTAHAGQKATDEETRAPGLDSPAVNNADEDPGPLCRRQTPRSIKWAPAPKLGNTELGFSSSAQKQTPGAGAVDHPDGGTQRHTCYPGLGEPGCKGDGFSLSGDGGSSRRRD